MPYSNLEYVADSILIERYMANSVVPLVKEAGIKEFFLSIGESIKESALSMWDPQHPIESIAKFTANGLAFIYTPWWGGLIYFICTEVLNFPSFDVLFEGVKQKAIAYISQNKSITTAALGQIVDSVVPSGGSSDISMADDNLTAERVFKRVKKAYDIFEQAGVANLGLIRLASVKEAGVFSWLTAPIKALLKTLVSKPVGGSFISKLLKFIFKTFFISIGKNMAGKAVRSVLPGAGEHGYDVGGGGSTSGTSYNMKPNGFGEERMPENWEEDVPLASPGLEDAIVGWAIQRYPQLASARNDILQSASFKAVIRDIRNNNSHNYRHDLTYIPHDIQNRHVYSKAELVDLFVGETAHKLGL